MNATTDITIAGLTAAVIVLVLNMRPWYTGGREMKKLAPFGKGAMLGLVSAVCPGGILGWLHAHSGGAANAAGGRLADVTTGIRPAAPIAHRALGGLDPGGACVVALVTVIVVLAWKFSGAQDKKRILGGAFVASVFCLTAGVIGALTWVPGTLNAVGDATAHAVGASL